MSAHLSHDGDHHADYWISGKVYDMEAILTSNCGRQECVRLDDLIFVDHRLQFGLRGSPMCQEVVARVIQEAHRAMMWASVGTSAAGEQAMSHMGVVRPTGKAREPLPPG